MSVLPNDPFLQAAIDEAKRLLKAGSFDLALLALTGRPAAGLALQPLSEEPLLLVCAPGHPLAGGPAVTLDRLAAEPFIDFPSGWGNRTVVDRAFAAAGLERQVLFEVADYAAAAGLVRHHLGVAFLPSSTTADLAGLARLRLSPRPLHWRLSVATPSMRRPSAAARAFLAGLLAQADPGQAAR